MVVLLENLQDIKTVNLVENVNIVNQTLAQM